MDELAAARYISLTTYRRDGTGVATPVWITGSGATFRFTTGDQAWKTRLLQNDPTVTVRVSDVRGRVAPSAATYRGTGVVKQDAASVAAVEQAIAERYGWQFRGTRVIDRVKTALRVGTKQAVVAVELNVRRDS